MQRRKKKVRSNETESGRREVSKRVRQTRFNANALSMQCSSQASFYFPTSFSCRNHKETDRSCRDRDSAWREAREDPIFAACQLKPTKNVTLELLKPRRMRPLFIRLQQSAKGPKNVSSRNGRRSARAKTRAKTEKRNVDRRGSWEEEERRPARVGQVSTKENEDGRME